MELLSEISPSTYFWVAFYLLGSYIVSYIGAHSNKINMAKDPTHIMNGASRVAYYVAIFLSWIIVIIFLGMALKVALSDNGVTMENIEDIEWPRTDTDLDNDTQRKPKFTPPPQNISRNKVNIKKEDKDD